MPIPIVITSASILQVVEQLETNQRQIPARRRARNLALIHNGNHYPVKLLISWGHEFVTGNELDSSLFTSHEARAYLREIGFEIVDI